MCMIMSKISIIIIKLNPIIQRAKTTKVGDISRLDFCKDDSVYWGDDCGNSSFGAHFREERCSDKNGGKLPKNSSKITLYFPAITPRVRA